MHDDNWPAFAAGLLVAALLTLIVAGAFGCVQLKQAHDQALEAKWSAEQERDRARRAELRAREAIEEARAEARKEREARQKAETALQQYGRAPAAGDRDGGRGGTRPMGGV
jgi:signal transduction histidine kinase